MPARERMPTHHLPSVCKQGACAHTCKFICKTHLGVFVLQQGGSGSCHPCCIRQRTQQLLLASLAGCGPAAACSRCKWQGRNAQRQGGCRPQAAAACCGCCGSWSSSGGSLKQQAQLLQQRGHEVVWQGQRACGRGAGMQTCGPTLPRAPPNMTNLQSETSCKTQPVQTTSQRSHSLQPCAHTPDKAHLATSWRPRSQRQQRRLRVPPALHAWHHQDPQRAACLAGPRTA